MAQLVRDDVRDALAAALDDAQARGALPRLPGAEITVERPQNPEHGDYASSVALRLAGTLKRAPLEVARAIADSLRTGALIAAVEVAPPGFINLRLSPDWKRAQVDAVLAAPDSWGAIDLGAGQTLQVEFVSANPTGPLQVGNGRGAVLGDVLASVLQAAGYDVQREYYVNDAGAQVRIFSETLVARYRQHFGRAADLPPGGYMGRYMIDLAAAIARDRGDEFLDLDPAAATDALGAEGLRRMLDQIRGDLGLLGVEFDRWFSEASLLAPREALAGRSTYETAMAHLRDGGHVVEKEGAIWFASSARDDKDNVIVRSSGEPTYFATDIAYHFDKFVLRGFDRVIDVWGADHQGHVARTKAATAAVAAAAGAGGREDGGGGRGAEGGLEMLLYQLVHLRRGTERVRMSKRTGELVTLRELLEEVGRDVTRYFMLQRSADAQMDFDLELAVSQDPKQNPVSYVQYAHARCAGILRTGAAEGLGPTGDVQALSSPSELALIDAMLRLPELIELMATKLEPHHLTGYALELAQDFTQFYGACRVVDAAEPELSRARLKLTRAAQIVLARTLGLMGVGAPDEM